MGADLYHTAEQALRMRVGDSAYAHCSRVADMAATLAATYGEDVELARLAGMLHDWDHDLDDAELVAVARGHGIPISDIDLRWPYLLHAKTAAADLADTFPDLPEEVLSAVRNHTVGAPDMSDLDKVVFLADSLEPARHYGEVSEVRDLVGRVDLDQLFVRTYRMSLMRIVDRRRWIHPETVTVWNALAAKDRR